MPVWRVGIAGDRWSSKTKSAEIRNPKQKKAEWQALSGWLPSRWDRTEGDCYIWTELARVNDSRCSGP